VLWLFVLLLLPYLIPASAKGRYPFHIIPDAGHLPMEEFPVQFNNIILNFLEGDKL
jgi:pimeloyl-ACP methyl ester carboxylesterase